MAVVVDHIFICTSADAPAARLLVNLGLVEGSSNRHPGQGTICRRFFFQTFMLELLWMEKASEAQSAMARPTRLWERFSAVGREASPFGVILIP